MEKLRMIGTEDGALVLVTESGQQFSLAIDDVLRAEVRRTGRDPRSRAAKPSPREIQSHIRSGLSAVETAQLLEISVEDVTRFEAPVLAEREYIVSQALAVPVIVGSEIDHDLSTTFGAAVRAKLTDAHATGEHWTSWKEESGWVVTLQFTASEIDHDARWSFDPRHGSLAPLNADATQLSRQGSLPEGLIPRLRALDVPGMKDDTRFDSGAFGRRAPESEVVPAPVATSSLAAQDAAIKRAPEIPAASNDTADLLEALRRRRGQREPMPGTEEEPDEARPVALFDALEPGYDDVARAESVNRTEDTSILFDETIVTNEERTGDAARRRGRSSMPSWDEIVFGARSDES